MACSMGMGIASGPSNREDSMQHGSPIALRASTSAAAGWYVPNGGQLLAGRELRHTRLSALAWSSSDIVDLEVSKRTGVEA